MSLLMTPVAEPQAPLLEAAGLRLDRAARCVSMGAEPIDLTVREVALLEALMTAPGAVVAREQLAAAVWADRAAMQRPGTLTDLVGRLRRKIEPDPRRPTRVVTVPGSGYRLEAGAPSLLERPSAPTWAAEGAADPALIVIGRKVVAANPALVSLLGGTDEADVVGHPFLEFVAPCSMALAMARYELAREGGHRGRPTVMTLRGVDGADRTVELASTMVLGRAEPATQVTLWPVEVESSRIRQAITGLHSDSGDALIVTDAQLLVRSLNAAAEELYGIEEANALGRTVWDLLPWVRDDLEAETVRATFQRHGRWHGTVVQRRPDGTTVTVDATVTLVRDAHGDPAGVVAVSRPTAPRLVTAPPAHRDQRRRSTTATDVRRAIERQELRVHYQPMVRLADRSVVGVEALVRWQHPTRGLLAPGDFLPSVEETGTIIELGQAVLDQAVRQWTTWRDQGIHLDLSVNLSAHQLADPHLTGRVADAIRSAGIPEHRLWLEVTETSLVEDLDGATRALQRLDELGACIAIDDFGTGWASLTYLRQFPVKALKIDRSFVSGLGSPSSRDAAIVGSVIALGRELGIDVLAEGVETEEQRAALEVMGCRQAQGYLFGRPVDAGDLTPWLARGRELG